MTAPATTKAPIVGHVFAPGQCHAVTLCVVRETLDEAIDELSQQIAEHERAGWRRRSEIHAAKGDAWGCSIRMGPKMEMT